MTKLQWTISRHQIRITKIAIALILLIVFVFNYIRLRSVLFVISDWSSRNETIVINDGLTTNLTLISHYGNERLANDATFYKLLYYYAGFYLIWCPMAIVGLVGLSCTAYWPTVTLAVLQCVALAMKSFVFYYYDIHITLQVLVLESVLVVLLLYYIYLLTCIRSKTHSIV